LVKPVEVLCRIISSTCVNDEKVLKSIQKNVVLNTLFTVETLVASFAEFQSEWEAGLTKSKSVRTLQEVVGLVVSSASVFVVPIRFSSTHGVWTSD